MNNSTEPDEYGIVFGQGFAEGTRWATRFASSEDFATVAKWNESRMTDGHEDGVFKFGRPLFDWVNERYPDFAEGPYTCPQEPLYHEWDDLKFEAWSQQFLMAVTTTNNLYTSDGIDLLMTQGSLEGYRWATKFATPQDLAQAHVWHRQRSGAPGAEQPLRLGRKLFAWIEDRYPGFSDGPFICDVPPLYDKWEDHHFMLWSVSFLCKAAEVDEQAG